MKVFIHIHNEGYYMDRRVVYRASFPCAPKVGDCIHIDNECWDDLVGQIIALGFPNINDYSNFIYGQEGHRQVSIDDCIYITALCWKPAGCGRYECHIQINSIPEDETDRNGGDITAEDYQILKSKWNETN